MKKIPLLFCLIALFVSGLGADTSGYRFTVQFSPANISWNPHYAYTTTEAQIFTAIYEGLVIFNPATLRPVPGAAESWELSEENTRITFTLREGITWSNGDRLTAQDFRDSWLVLLAPETEAGYASLLDDIIGAREYRTGTGSVDDVKINAVDERTLVVDLKQPSPQFLSILCHYSFAPVYKDFRKVSDWSALRSVPVNGPYTIRARSSGEILLDKNSLYWDADSVKVEGLRLLFTDDSDKTMEGFNRFQIDWIISGMDTAQLAIPEAMSIEPLFSTTYYYFSNTTPVWSNPDIRRAMALLVPWDEIRSTRLIPGTSLVPPIPNYPMADAGFPPKEEQKDAAMALFEKAGYPLGKGLPNPVIRVPSQDAVAEAMKSAWDEVLGMNTEIQIVEFPDYYDSVKTGGYDIATLTWTGDYADPHTFLGMWDSGSSFNDASYSNAEYDKLLHDAAKLPFLQRFAKLREAEELLLRSCEVIPIEHFPAVNIIDRRFIEGWYPNALDIHPFKNLSPRLGYDIPGVVMGW
ncbi:MAG: peptide ABC transporter substrate-binding protein [Spirochaetes bacterium]|nr:MAG: peptide ABC transporter substrate-binding protein [Spirochaetota bacterium]